MSTKYVRDKFKTFLATEYPTLKVVDISGEYLEFADLLQEQSIGPDDNFLAVQFIGDRIDTVSLSASNGSGGYRERGAIFLHVVEPVSRQAMDNILTRGDSYIDTLTNRRIDNLVIDQVNPINTAQGATLEFQGGYISGSIYTTYYRDKNL